MSTGHGLLKNIYISVGSYSYEINVYTFSKIKTVKKYLF